MSKWPNSTQEQDRPNTFFFQKNMPAHKIFFSILKENQKKTILLSVCLSGCYKLAATRLGQLSSKFAFNSLIIWGRTWAALKPPTLPASNKIKKNQYSIVFCFKKKILNNRPAYYSEQKNTLGGVGKRTFLCGVWMLSPCPQGVPI